MHLNTIVSLDRQNTTFKLTSTPNLATSGIKTFIKKPASFQHRNKMHFKMFALVLLIIAILQGNKADQRCTKQESHGVCIPDEFERFRKDVELKSNESTEINVYTPYQCLDQCHRQIKCTGVTFIMKFPFNYARKQRCKLFYAAIKERKVSCDQQQLCFFSVTKNWALEEGNDE